MATDEAEYPYFAQPATAVAESPFAAQELPADDDWLDVRQATALGWLAVLFTVFAFVDLSLYPLAEAVQRRNARELMLLAAIGVVIAQVCLFAAAFVFAPLPLLVRAGACWFAALVLLGCNLAGIATHLWLDYDYVRDWNLLHLATWSSLLLLPAALVFIPAPLWFLRIYLGWSLVRPQGYDTPRAPARRLAIRDYLLATAIVGGALALVRWHATGALNATEFSASVAVSITASFLMVIPGMLLLLRGERWQRGLAFFALYVLLLGSLPLAAAIVWRWGTALWIGLYELAMFYAPFLAWGTAVAAGLFAFRIAGYRLRMGRF